MTPQPVKPDIERQVESLPDQKALVAYLERCKGDLIQTTEMMAHAVAKAQREGWTIPDEVLSRSQQAWLMKIANRQVEARLYTQLSGYTPALRLFSGLPIQEQRKIAEQGSVEVVEPGGDKRRVGLLHLESSDLKQLFDRDGSMRSEGAQKHYLKNAANEPRSVRAESDTATIVADKRCRAIVVKWADRSVKIPQKEVMRLLEQIME